MDAFTELDAVAAPLLRDDIDTDALIPLERMKAMDADFGSGLLANLRYRADGSENADFVLNQSSFRGARILVAGSNFGCGSSREQAVWALYGFGIRCVIAAGFADIFHANCIRQGVLPVCLPRSDCAALAQALEARPGRHLRVDLRRCEVHGPQGTVHRFTIDALDREMLLQGLDAIALTLRRADAIAAFQARDSVRRPWIHGLKLRPRQPRSDVPQRDPGESS